MFFKKQKFFLDLTGQGTGEQESKGDAPKVTIAPPPAAPAAKPAKEKPAAKVVPAPAPAASAPVPVSAPPAAAAAATSTAAPRTTAEEIAAELAAEAASRPAPTLATFAPECLTPGAATPRRRRSAGANLGAFKEIARGLMKS